ncbi:MAG: methyltransferase [Planctomycetota bacterium]
MNGEPQSDADHLLQLLGGKHRAQALSTAAALGLADLLARGPRPVAELAGDLGCDRAGLESLLRLLAGLEFVSEPAPDVFALTTRGRTLCRDQLGPLAEFVGTPQQWDPWARLRDGLRSGQPAFDRTFGVPLYAALARDPDAAACYDRAIDAFTRHEAIGLGDRLDLANARVVVDVGGGRGTLLLELLGAWPQLRGILFDLPHVADATRARLEAAAPGRVEARGGDFFAAVPAGADVYLLKHVLHNWDDDRAVRLLANCGAAMAADGRVIAICAVLAPDNRPDLARLLDLEMRVLTGGRERRKPELRRLFAAAGLALTRVEPLTAASWLLVGQRPK